MVDHNSRNGLAATWPLVDVGKAFSDKLARISLCFFIKLADGVELYKHDRVRLDEVDNELVLVHLVFEASAGEASLFDALLGLVLVACLTEDMVARLNECWAFGYILADAALEIGIKERIDPWSNIHHLLGPDDISHESLFLFVDLLEVVLRTDALNLFSYPVTLILYYAVLLKQLTASFL